MSNVSRSTAGAYLQLCHMFGVEPENIPNTTLNEKFDIHAGEYASPTDDKVIRYICIGNGGHRAGPSEGNATSIAGTRRRAKAGALYSHIPFIMRPVDNDLSQAERSKYRLRVIEQHDGQEYYVYYLRVLELGEAKPSLQEITNINGEIVTQSFIPDNSDLYPVPPTDEVVDESLNSEISVTMQVPFELNENDVNEIINAIDIIYNESGFAIISEMGLVSGVDRAVTISNNGSSEESTEVIEAQLVTSLNSGKLLDFGKPVGITYIDIGSIDPMYR